MAFTVSAPPRAAPAEKAGAGKKTGSGPLAALLKLRAPRENDDLSPATLSLDDVTTAVLLSICLHLLLASPWWLAPPSNAGPTVTRISLAPPPEVVETSEPLGTRNGTEKLTREELPPMDRASMADMHANQGNRINACVRCTLTRGDFSGGLYRVANLRGADMRAANLADADFSAARLVGAKLARADMRGARLQGSLLIDADLRLADLTGANLLGAWLENADFTGANLTGAKMTEIDMADGASFRDAIMHNVDLRRSNLGAMDFYRADLSGADLRFSNGLKQKQLDYACGDANTRLPDGLTIARCEG